MDGLCRHYIFREMDDVRLRELHGLSVEASTNFLRTIMQSSILYN